MRREETSVNGSGQAVREALARKSDWEHHGPSQWGYGVAIDLLALERRVSALEKGDCPARMEFPTPPGEGWRWVAENEALEDGDEFFYAANQMWYPSVWRAVKVPPGIYRRRVDAQSNHDAATAARATTDASPLRPDQGVTVGMGTGDTTASACDGAVSPSGSGSGGSLSRSAPERQSPARECGGGEPLDDTQPDNGMATGGRGRNTQEPVAWAVMLADNHRIWGVYALEEEANAINDVVAGGHGVAPLYRSPTLTDAERGAITYYIGTGGPEGIDATLRGLLERTK